MAAFIPIEIGKREVFTATILAINLSKLKIKVVIGDQVLVQKIALRVIGKHIYFEKSLDVLKELFYKKIFKKFKIISQDVEWTAISNPDLYAATRYHSKTLKYASMVLCSGPFEKKLLSEKYPYFDYKLFDIGNYRNSIIHHYGYNYFKKKSLIVSSRYNRFALYISNFGSCINSNEAVVISDIINRTGDIRKAELLRFVADRHLHRKQRAFDFVAFINEELLNNNKQGIKTVLRIHPTEIKKDWINIGISNDVILDNSGPILPLMISAEKIYHPGCTSAIESHLIGLKSIYYNNNYKETYDKNLTSMVSESYFNNNTIYKEENIKNYLNYKIPIEDIINNLSLEKSSFNIKIYDKLLILILGVFYRIFFKWTIKYNNDDHNEIINILKENNIKFKNLGNVIIL